MRTNICYLATRAASEQSGVFHEICNRYRIQQYLNFFDFRKNQPPNTESLHNGLYLNFHSKHSYSTKKGIKNTLMDRAKTRCSTTDVLRFAKTQLILASNRPSENIIINTQKCQKNKYKRGLSNRLKNRDIVLLKRIF